jgi:hypothetical protein
MACLKITFGDNGLPILEFNLDPSGTLNGYDWFTFTYYGDTYFMWHDPVDTWYIGPNFNSIVGVVGLLKSNTDACPTASQPQWEATSLDLLKTECDCPEGVECDREDRHFELFKSIKLPKVCVEENRGIDDCCCEYLVLGNTGNQQWKNDITSAWLKVSDPADGYSFKLFKDGVLATYQPPVQPFVNEQNAYYCTINWGQVLVSDGVGCYELRIGYDISGILGDYLWGRYKLQPYSVQNAVKTARIRAKFSGYHEIEGINFTDSNITSDLRFYGFIGNRQPNMEIDNIIYRNREMKRVIRENLNSYEIITDPSHKCITQPMVDLYLLSENELYISDYNAHAHDYCLYDVPVIVEESPEIEYYEFSRKAKVTCQVGDKFKNKRTYY